MKDFIIASIVFREVKKEYGVTAAQMNSSTRVAKVREARQVFTQLMREHSSMTVEQIGMLVNRDHATVSVTTKVVRSELDTNVGYKKRYMRLKNNIENQIEDGKELC